MSNEAIQFIIATVIVVSLLFLVIPSLIRMIARAYFREKFIYDHIKKGAEEDGNVGKREDETRDQKKR